MKQAEKISEEAQLKLNDGLCVKQLDKALQGINVKRQAYFSHSFVGNHVHKCCKVHVTMCNN
ncbi:MAG: hypothetical protein DSY43_00520 [Gammaproteobacteria bacterium]|nr:MAG: hypothetical protein DSY43_00520 [Gammaproteobacteria bacterium]